jgi:hypothetical protein
VTVAKREMSHETRIYLRDLRASRQDRKQVARDKAGAQKQCDTWNAAHGPRVPVVLTDDLGDQHRTMTRSIAWEVCGHASVLVDGRTGGYLLERIAIDAERLRSALWWLARALRLLAGLDRRKENRC